MREDVAAFGVSETVGRPVSTQDMSPNIGAKKIMRLNDLSTRIPHFILIVETKPIPDDVHLSKKKAAFPWETPLKFEEEVKG